MDRNEITARGEAIDRAAQLALAHAKSLGIDEITIGTAVGAEKRLVVENKEFTLANTIDSQSIGIEVHKGKKKGSASVNVTDPSSVKKAVEDALALANFSVADEWLRIADQTLAPKAKTLPFLFDDKLARMSLADLEPTMSELLKELTSDERVALDRFEMTMRVGRQSMLNSNGVYQTEHQTMINWDFVGMAVKGEQVSGMSYDSGFSYGHDGFKTRATKQISEFKERVIRSLDPRPAPSYHGLVVFGPRAFKSIFVNTILFQASGRSVMDKKSKWENFVGKSVASPLLTIVDNPHAAELMGCTAYDGEGLPTRFNSILDAGKLVQFNCDLYSGAKLGVAPRGLDGGPFGLIVSPGSMTLDEMTKSRKEILFIDRFSGNTDTVTGDFSGVAKSSAIYKDGKFAYSTTETMIAGNALTLLNKLVGLCQTPEIVSGSYSCPAVLIDDVSVTGK